MTTLLPLYVHPAQDPRAWSAAAAAGPEVTAIINVHDGPGEPADLCDAYRAALDLLVRAGVPLLGYVDLDYGRRSDRAVDGDRERWRRLPVTGLFYDQAPTDPAYLGRAAQLAESAQAAELTVLNPGTRPHPAYAVLADLVCTFEGPWQAYRDLPGGQDWPNAAHLVHGVPAAELGQARALLDLRARAGLVTDLAMPLPYCGVPSWLLSAPVPR